MLFNRMEKIIIEMWSIVGLYFEKNNLLGGFYLY